AVLPGLSACAGIVMVPKREPVLRQFGFVPLSATQELAALVGQEGSVAKRVVELPPGNGQRALQEAANHVSTTLAGLTLAQAQTRLATDIDAGLAAIDQAARTLVESGLAIWSRDNAARPVLIIRGQANLIDEHVAADLERVRLLLDDLEGKQE